MATTAFLVCLFATGCGGEASKAIAPEPEVDLSQLDVGNYPSKPVALGLARTDEEAALVEAQRLAEFTPLLTEVDPALNFTFSYDQSRTFVDVSKNPIARHLLMSREEFEATAPGFIAGYYTEARTNENLNLSWQVNHFTMLYTDAESAKNAVSALGDKHQQALGDPYQGTRLEKYPEAHAVWTPRYDSLYAWHSSGRFLTLSVINDRLGDQIGHADLPGMQAKAEKVIEAMTARLQKFVPTPHDRRTTLDRDIDGMLAMTVPAVNDTQSNSVTIPAVYQRHGALQVSPKIAEDQELFEETGVDLVSFYGGALFRTEDNKAAQQLATWRLQLGRLFVAAPSPKGLPSARCQESREQNRGASPRYYCTTTFGRYAAQIAANQLADAHQRISAQYSLLANSK